MADAECCQEAPQHLFFIAGKDVCYLFQPMMRRSTPQAKIDDLVFLVRMVIFMP